MEEQTLKKSLEYFEEQGERSTLPRITKYS